MYKIALIGHPFMVKALRNTGIDVFGCDNECNLEKILDNIVYSKEYAVAFITEKLAATCLEKISLLESKLNIVLIPDHLGSTGLFKEKLDNLIKLATGTSKS